MKSPIPIFWLVVFGLVFLGVSFWIADRPSVCASSMVVEVGHEPVVNPVTCR